MFNKIKKMLWIIMAIATIATPVMAGANEDLGTVLGGITGGIVGNSMGHGSGRTVATIGGAVIGGLVGGQLGNSADREQSHYRHAEYTEWHTRPNARMFIGKDGRLCRYSILRNDFGDRVEATFCCYRMSPQGYCQRWVSIS